MATFYLVCLVLGGSVLLLQFLMSLVGLGGHHDVELSHEVPDAHVEVGGDHPDVGGDHPDHAEGHHTTADGHGGAWYAGMLSLRAIVAALCFFGVGGLAATSAAWANPWPLVVAGVAGFAAMYIVARLMTWLHTLQADGTIRIHNCLGHAAKVYLTVPASKSGVGKVTVAVQNRTMEYLAVTQQPRELPTGASVKIVGVAGPRTVEVALLAS